MTGREQEIRRLTQAIQQKRRELQTMEARLDAITRPSVVKPVEHQDGHHLETRT